jgi:hypothetical protein
MSHIARNLDGRTYNYSDLLRKFSIFPPAVTRAAQER